MAYRAEPVDIAGGVSDAWSSVATFVPKLLFFLVILLVGYIIAKVLSRVVERLLERVGFDTAVERGGIGAAMEQSAYDPSDVVAKLVKYTVLLFTLVIAFDVFGPNAISDLLEQVVAFLPAVIVAIIIIVVAAAVAAAVNDIITNVLGGLSYGKMLARLAAGFILFLGAVAALNQMGVATAVTTPVLIAILATVGGILVVGIGGGLVRPMQSRWDGYLNRLEAEAPNMRRAVANGPTLGEQAHETADRLGSGGASRGPGRVGAHAGSTSGDPQR